jgi:protein-tyrosine phosphatase
VRADSVLSHAAHSIIRKREDVVSEFNNLRSNVVQMPGIQNFREVAGYLTVDGRRLKRNKLWRSATLHELDVAECLAIIDMGIHTIADFRGPDERREKPTPTELSARTHVLSWVTEGMPAANRSFRELLLQAKDPEQIRDLVARFYLRIADDHAVQLRDTYRAIADGRTPLLIHCAAGKDRTGVAIAILLDLLGVRRQDTLEDYEISEHLLDWDQMSFAAALGLHDERGSAITVPPFILKPLMRSDRAYLEAALGDIEARYGSTESFCRERLGLDTQTIEALRAALLED